jgi:RNA polymerase sigma-70 factor (ECF subfamily)
VWAVRWIFIGRVNLFGCGRNRAVVDDDGLIAAVAAGDDAALRELFERHAPWLAARLRRRLAAADVEDVLQETFLVVWRDAARYQPQGSGGAWLWGIARRQAALLLRRRGPSLEVLGPVVGGESGLAGDPAQVAVDRVELAEAFGALGPDGTELREVSQLLFVDDRSVTEVAALTGVPLGTVKSRAFRARRLLRAALGSRGAAEGGSR